MKGGAEKHNKKVNIINMKKKAAAAAQEETLENESAAE